MSDRAPAGRRINPWLQLLLFPLALALAIAPLLLLDGGILQLAAGAAALTLVLWAWAHWIERQPVERYGLAAKARFGWDLAAGLAMGALAVAAIVGVAALLGYVRNAAWVAEPTAGE